MGLASLKTEAYSNWLMIGPDGAEMCRCAEKRARWYLDRDLADVVNDNPPTIRLKFQPKGNGNEGDAFSLAPKQNICVVCGTDEDLTKHHIVPQMYRRFLPEQIKGRSSHDVVVICIPCHERYEADAATLKKQIFSEYGVEEKVNASQEQRDLYYAAKLCSVLLKQGDLIPIGRREEMMAKVASLYGKIPSTEEFQQIANSFFRVNTTADPGKAVVEKVLHEGDLEAFVKRWRSHFINTATPKFMPAHWSIDRQLTSR